jgi:hypothetical protein
MDKSRIVEQCFPVRVANNDIVALEVHRIVVVASRHTTYNTNGSYSEHVVGNLHFPMHQPLIKRIRLDGDEPFRLRLVYVLKPIHNERHNFS